MAPPGFGRATQPNPRSSKTLSRPTNPLTHPVRSPTSATPQVRWRPQPGATSPARISVRETPGGEPLLGRTGAAAARPRRRRPHAATPPEDCCDHDQPRHTATVVSRRTNPLAGPTERPELRGSPRPGRHRLEPSTVPSESHPTANSVRVLQKALHQQRRVFRDVANSAATSPRSRSRTGRVVSIGMLHPSEAIRPSRGPGSIWVGLPLTSGPTEACAPGPAVNIASRLSKTPVIWSTLAGMPETGPWRDRGSSLARGRRPPDASARVPLTLRTHETRSALSATRDCPTDLQPHIPPTGLLTRGGRVGAGRAR